MPRPSEFRGGRLALRGLSDDEGDVECCIDIIRSRPVRYECMYACMYGRMCAYKGSWLSVSTSGSHSPCRMYVCTFVLEVCIIMYAPLCIYSCMNSCMYACMYGTYVLSRMYVFMYVCV
jgi:hypothetical protein